MEHSFATLPLRSLLLLAVVAAGCEGERASTTAIPADSWTAPLPPSWTPTLPQVDGISPALASPAMTVRISGAGFGTTLSDVVVSFGGVASEPISVSENEIRVHPAAGGAVAADGTIDVIVSVAGLPSNAGTMRLGTMGDIVRIDTVPPETVGDVLALADGSTVVTDPVGGHLYRISAEGVVRAVADPLEMLQSPGSTVLTSDGGVLVFDAAASAIWRYEPADGALTAWLEVTPGWTDGAWLGDRLYAIASNGSSIERIEANGVHSATVPLDACEGVTSIAALNGLLHVVAGSRICTVDAVTGFEAEITLSGETAWLIESITAADDALIATGIFTYGPAVARIDAGGSISLVATPSGYAKAAALSPAGMVVGYADGNVMLGSRLVATRVRDLGDFREIDGRRLATGGAAVPFLAEIWADGAYQVLATGEVPSMWMHIEADGDGYLVAVFDMGQVLRVAADGTLSVLIDHSSIGPVASFVRSTSGEFLVSSYGPDISRYDANGTLIESAYVHAEGAYAFGLVVVGETVFAAAGDRLLEADASEGGAAISRSSTMNGLLGIAADVNGRVYVSDGNDTGDILRLDGSTLVKVGYAGTAMSLAVAADGAILVADVMDVPYSMLP